MLTFEIPAVKCHNGVKVNWSRYRDTGVTDPALVKSQSYVTGSCLQSQAKEPHRGQKMVIPENLSFS